MDRYITLSQAALRNLYCSSLTEFRWRRSGDNFRPTMKGFCAGFCGLEVGKVFMLLFRSSLDERLSTRCSRSCLELIFLPYLYSPQAAGSQRTGAFVAVAHAVAMTRMRPRRRERAQSASKSRLPSSSSSAFPLTHSQWISWIACEREVLRLRRSARDEHSGSTQDDTLEEVSWIATDPLLRSMRE